MKPIAQLKKYFEQRQQKQREIGRYYASELYNIMTGKLNEKNYFEPKKYTADLLVNFSRGEMGEDFWTKLYETIKGKFISQVKKERRILGKEYSIICKVDLEFEDRILEIKCPNYLPDDICDYHKPQLEAYYRTFYKPVQIFYFDVKTFDYRSYIYKPEKKFWRQILSKVDNFHNLLILNYGR